LPCGGIGVDLDTAWNEAQTPTAARVVSTPRVLRVTSGQAKVREIQDQGKVREFWNWSRKSGKTWLVLVEMLNQYLK